MISVHQHCNAFPYMLVEMHTVEHTAQPLNHVPCARLVTNRLRNFFWAFIFNLLGLPLAAGVFWPHLTIPPAVAGAAMASSSVIVVGSSLLLRPVFIDMRVASRFCKSPLSLM